MPTPERVQAAVCVDKNQRRCPKNVADKNPAAAEHQQDDSLAPAQLKQFAKNERDHDSGLERLHSAAGFVDSDKSVRELNDVADLIRRDPDPARDVDCDVSHGASERLHDSVLEQHWPRNCHEREANRKSKVSHPGRSADAPQLNECDRDHEQREHPAEKTPVGICFFHDSDRQKQGQQYPDRGLCRDGVIRSRHGPRFPPDVEQEDREKRHRPAVVVLRVQAPVEVQMPAQPKPKHGWNGNVQERHRTTFTSPRPKHQARGASLLLLDARPNGAAM